MKTSDRDGSACPGCGAPLERLGAHRQVTRGSVLLVRHYACGACGRRFLHHSRLGWKETRVDLTPE